MYSRLCLFMFLYLLSFAAYAQNNTKHVRYTTANGLSDNRITTIIKDRDGFMWFGTWVGISRFDGYRFSIFKSYPGDHSPLKNNRIDDIVEDKTTGDLWIKAYDSQVYRFDKKLGVFSALSDLLKQEAVKNVVFTKMLLVDNNTIWLETDNAGIFLVNNSSSANPSLIKFSASANLRLPSNNITSFKIDENKKVWIGTNKGLRVFLPNRNKGYEPKNIPSTLKNETISSVVEGNTKYWITNQKGILFGIDKTTLAFKSFQVTSSAIHYAWYSKKYDKVYCTTAKGELIAVSNTGSIEYLAKMTDDSALFAAFEDADGTLWIESQNYGIVKFDIATKQLSYLLHRGNYPFKPKIWNSTIFQDKNGTVWINLKEKGLLFYDKSTKSLKVFSNRSEAASKELSNNIIRCFYDPSGVMWMGSGFDGVEKIVFQESNFTQFVPKPLSTLRSENEVRGIYSDRNNRLWLGTKDGQLHITKDNKRIANIFLNQPEKHAGVYSITEDWKGNVWLGTKPSGLMKAQPVDAIHSKYHFTEFALDYSGPTEGKPRRSIYSLLEDNQRRLWAGTFGDGLVQIVEEKGKVSYKTIYNAILKYPKGNFIRIRHLAEDAKGRIWIGTTGGLLVFNPAGKSENYTFKVYKKELGNINSLGGDDVQYIFKDSKNRMWVLTSAGGLNLAEGNDPTKALTFINYSTKNGLPSDCLLGCLEDKQGNLWLATQNGISKFDVNNKKFQNFNHNDGIHDATLSEASSTVNKNGDFVFGTTFGYLSFNPENVKATKVPAKMAFTNLQINSEDLVPGESSALKADINNLNELELEHNQNGISIEFAVLDYRSVDKQNFSYRLKGFDDVWRNTDGQRRATYTNLPPGDYVFEVRSLNDELYDQLPFKSIPITILPPFWKTWWAYLAYLILLTAIFVAIRRVVITVLKLRQSVEVEKRLAELKLNFFTQISHELRTPLTLIMNPSEEVLQNENLTPKGKEYMSIVVKNASRMVKLVNQVLDLRKVQSGKATLKITEINVYSFVEEILLYFKDGLAQKNINVLINNERQLLLWGDAEKLEIIIYNVLANAIKFSPAHSNIQINIVEVDGCIKIDVIDEGPGVKHAELDDIFKLYYEGGSSNGKNVKGTGIGLALSKELVELHEGKITAANHSPKGLRISIELKSGNSHFNAENVHVFEDGFDSPVQYDVEPKSEIEVKEVFEVESKVLPTVLVVEDNHDLRSFLTNKLTEYYKVESANNGLIGLQKAKELIPDLILSDIMMPEMDGVEMLDQLKTDPTTSHIPVILLTAKHSIESQIEGLKYGADYYLTKPIKMELLQVAMTNILNRRRQFAQSLIAGEVAEEEEVKESFITAYDKEFLEKIIHIVEGKLDDEEFNIDYVADAMAMSRSAFFKKLKSLTDLAPVEFVRDLRLRKAKEIFDAGEENISTVAYAIGFSNPKYFSTCFRSKYNQTPSEYLKSIRQRRK
ncbi:hybrid sensor histidine kinase/response regulator transcription factor [Pedobacter xixiisoli]|uniref:histidine kinase n=1 Tax=Pedobacter xixiisoli TaxID=1476464 RepID=A0A285ZRA0_9SPHI|nr:hybrid sensor histidine kinase/response regulator transcription factor [Pedobacter xixiisoli]SOD12152.1 Two component regulator propeller [Pedobacter xixiisoli]